MIRILGLLLLSIGCWVLSGIAMAEDAANRDPRNREAVVLDIRNMSCPLCRITVQKALMRVPGVESAKVDYEQRSAIVIFDPAVTPVGDLIEATTEAGYPSSIRSESTNPGVPKIEPPNPPRWNKDPAPAIGDANTKVRIE